MHGGFALESKQTKKPKNSKHGAFMQMQSRGKGKQTQQNYNFWVDQHLGMWFSSNRCIWFLPRFVYLKLA